MATIEENLSPDVLGKVKASLATKGKINITTQDPDEIDVDSFFGNTSKEKASELRPDDVAKKDQEVMLAIKECDELIKDANHFQQEYVMRGNQALYKLLTDIYSFVLKVQISQYRHHIFMALISALKDRDIKVQDNTSETMIVVKYIVGRDRKRAANYSRVLDIAIKENLAPKDLIDYIGRRGGIGQIYATEQEFEAKQSGSKLKDKRLSVLREMLICREWESTVDISFEGNAHHHSDEIDCKRSDFVFFMARHDRATGNYKILHAHNFGEKFENQIIRHMTKGVKVSLETLEENLRTYCKKLINTKKVPEVIAKIWQNGRLQLPSNLRAPEKNL